MGSTTVNRGKIAASSFVLFCLALFLSAYTAKEPSLAQVGYTVVSTVLSPIVKLNDYLSSSVSGLWRNYIDLIDLRQEADILEKRLDVLEAENSRLIEFENENQRLKSLLSILSENKLNGIGARVIGYDPASWVKSVTIDRGSKDGIQVGMAVLQGRGVVGQVTKVGLNSAQVLLITDHASGVDVLIQGSRARGIVEGSGGRLCRIQYVLKEDQVEVGDRIITSGVDGVFPKGLLVGIVSAFERGEAQFLKVEVKPTVDFDQLEEVVVVSAARTKE